LLLEFLSRESGALLGGIYTSLDLLIVAVPIWLFTSAVVLVGLSRRDEPGAAFSEALRGGLSQTLRLGLLWLATRFAQGLVVGLPLMMLGTSLRAVDYWVDERLEGWLIIGVVGLGGLLALWLQFGATLIAAALVQGTRLTASFIAGLRALRARPSTFVPWLAYQVLAMALHGFAAWVLGAVPGAPHPLLAAAVHQMAMLGSLALHATALVLVVERMRTRGDDLVHLGITTSGTLPPDVEPHDPAT
jgi:hypothetical protein